MQQRAALVVLSSTLVALAACGGESSPGGAGGGPAADAFSLHLEGITVAPGEEHTKCVVKRLGNTEAIHVDRIENTLGAGSHHLILYKSTDTEERATPFDCKPFTNLLKTDGGVPLMVTQKKDDALQLPPNVGISFEAGQMIRIEVHYINTGSSPIEVKATSTFHAIDAADLEHEADFMMVANTDVDLAPQSAATLGPQYMPLPGALADAKFFAFTGHQHRLGTGVAIATAAGEDDPGTTIYAPGDYTWDEPPVVYTDPPIAPPAGGGFRFSCTWQNDTADHVGFGESANDEMCLFWTYYFPSRGPMACAHTSQIAGGADFCCPGDPICAMLP